VITFDAGGYMEKATLPGSATTRKTTSEYENLKAAAAAVQKIRINAQRELELARKMRAEAQIYQRATEMKARSEAQQLILRTRLSTQKEVEELIRKAADEIQKVLADIRVIRITAQEELAAQRKFTDAAKIASLSLALDKDKEKQLAKKAKQPAGKKQANY
jgi:hypothetical protein